jgi:hypothetical protein
MKYLSKIILSLFILLMLVGCSDSKSEDKEKIKEEEKASELIHEQLMVGDFSSVAGEYISTNGKTVVIDNEGLRDGEKAEGAVYYINDSIYQMSLRTGDDPAGGYMITVYPVGVEVEGIPTDTTKVRIAYGQAEPLYEEEIYTKK